MGLDISVYPATELVADHPYDETTCWPLGHIQPYVNPDFLERADGMDQRCRISTAKNYGFCCGPYSNYNAWRDDLARFAGWTADNPATPFNEMIYFSDCEGILGPQTCAKLARDFREHLPRVDSSGNSDYWKKKYRQWMEAFESITPTGFVVFH